MKEDKRHIKYSIILAIVVCVSCIILGLLKKAFTTGLDLQPYREFFIKLIVG